MSAELSRCYELLGVEPGASVAELKAAHRDMAKVWHPDRFANDERLQKKAQDKLKEINEAYELLISGKTPRSRSDAATHDSRPSNAQENAKPLKWQWAVVTLMIFFAVFFAVSRLRKSDASVGQSNERKSVESQKEIPANHVTSESRDKKAVESAVSRDARQEAPTSSQPVIAPIQGMATVTVLVDPSTGLLATAECPTKTRMTYAAGAEPHAYCAAHQKSESGDSKVKAIAKRVVTPTEWVGGGKKKSEGDRQ